jgi:hypothetical protein
MLIKTPEQAAAKRDGFRALTTPYSLKERDMMDKVVADMERGGIKYRLVQASGGVEVWRK